MMDEHGKSDRFVVPLNAPNVAPERPTEAREGRKRTKGNSPKHTVARTQRRTATPSALERVRQAARRDSKQRFTALLHHVYNIERLRAAYFAVKRDAAAGVDGETWQHYGAALEANLQDLSQRLRRGAYRARPVRRAYIPEDGRAAAAARRSHAGRTKSSSAPSSEYWTRFTKRTSSGSRMASGLGAARTGHWTRSPSAS